MTRQSIPRMKSFFAMVPGSSPSMTEDDGRWRSSIRGHAARLDRAAPARDLAGDELGKIFRASALGWRDLLAEGFEALADIGCVQRIAHGLIEAAHDQLRRAFGQEQALPGADFEIEALLARGRDIRQDDRAPRPRAGDRLDGVA